tara:strand:+ start:697 stop:915 length:219 start_codon:yes stop_codon:yes gene_type:complete
MEEFIKLYNDHFAEDRKIFESLFKKSDSDFDEKEIIIEYSNIKDISFAEAEQKFDLYFKYLLYINTPEEVTI